MTHNQALKKILFVRELLMLELWVWITLFAVIMQVIRHSLQKHLTSRMNPMCVVCTRFFFGLPFGILYYSVLINTFEGGVFPSTTLFFWFYCLFAAVTQIAGTFFLVLLFRQRNFAVGITYQDRDCSGSNIRFITGW